MKKFMMWTVIGVLLLSTLACRLSSPVEFDFSTEPTPTALSQSDEEQTPTDQIEPPLPTVNPDDFLVPTVQPLPELPEISGGQQDDLLVTLYERVNPGIVSIQVLSTEGGSGLGSGFVVDKEGHIVTNFHVVEGADTVEVDFPSGYKTLGEVIGTDLDSDIAVIKVDAPADQLFPVTLGNSDDIRIGQTVIAIGNPYGLSSTMTVGIVSAKGRTLESMRATDDGRFFTAGDIIQTDASINPGNSGGPLLNLDGEVVGINRAIRTSGTTDTGDPVNTGIGFAVSINILKRVLPTLMKGETYFYPYLGLTSQEDLSLMARQALGLKRTTGAYVVSVVAGGPADQAGIRAGTRQTDLGIPAGGDLIIAVDGRPVRVFGDLLGYLMSNKSPGEEIVLTIVRDNKEMEVTITLGKRQ